jgi:hypothetical protein
MKTRGEEISQISFGAESMMHISSKRSSLIAVALLFAATAAFAGVTVSSPGLGSTDSSPVHFVASASGASPILAMKIYVDSQSVFAVNAASLNTSVSMSKGAHSISVQAWDTKGTVYKQQFTITVSSSSGIPPGATTASAIQNRSDWQNCTVCAGIGASGPTAPVSVVQFQKTPSLSGSSAKFTIGGSTPYADSLWWQELGAHSSATHFQYDMDLYMTDPQASQALEFDITQYVDNQKFIMGIQCDFKSRKTWDVFNTGGNQWESTGIACTPPSAFTWHHLTYEGQRTSSETTVVSITFDGVTHIVNKTYKTTGTSGNGLAVSLQMDLDSKPTPYSEWVDNFTLTYW